MTEEPSQRVRIWRYPRAPIEIQQLFPDGGSDDWLVHATASEFRIIGPSLLGWSRIHPVKAVELADGSTVLWGAPRRAISHIASLGKSVVDKAPEGKDRRACARVHIECPIRYEVHSEPKRAGTGQSIDISNMGICFACESLLPAKTKITVWMQWPIGLEDGLPVELHAEGKLVRSEPNRAAMQMEDVRFWTVA